jgi:hypothetical protein
VYFYWQINGRTPARCLATIWRILNLGSISQIELQIQDNEVKDVYQALKNAWLKL